MDIDDAIVPGLHSSGLDACAFEEHSVAAVVELFDVDGDGLFETRVSTTDAGVTVATDRDADGVTDTFSSFGRGGHYESWAIFRAADGTARWEQSASEELFP
ncbi:DUF6802 family protein [Rhodococcoides yunnanense]|uniref:DUF6802 family protein n=1 Tax=Rhodococcoides yunnanense TaxID=278209 RepID=UPI0009327603|nr:DUF6802 family protein [Rhodococcus yunnanensis]